MPESLPTDFHATILAAQAGCREALSVLCEETAKVLQRRARRRMRMNRPADCEDADLVQEALLKLLRHLGRFRGRSVGEFVSWAVAILDNVWRDRIRRNRRRLERSYPLEIEAVNGSLQARSLVHATSPDAEAMVKEERLLLFVTVLFYEEHVRHVVFARWLDGLSFEDIGRRMDCSADAARMRYERTIAEVARFWRRLRLGASQPDSNASAMKGRPTHESPLPYRPR